MLSEEAAHTNAIVFGLTQSGRKLLFENTKG